MTTTKASVAGRTVRDGTLVALALIVVAAPGCQGAALPPAAGATPATVVAAANPVEAAAPRLRNVEAPPGFEAADLQPRTGDSRRRALLSIDQIVATLPAPDFVTEAAGAEAAPFEVPLAAQHAYVAGRQAWRDGRNAEATRQLQVAQRLAPRAPQIHRLLAQTNPIRAAFHLERALALDPSDAPSAFALGRKLLEQRQWEPALSALIHAQQLLEQNPDGDPALRLMVCYYLGGALQRQGYDAATIDQMTRFLEAPLARGPRSRLRYSLLMARRLAGAMWRTIGDAHNRLNEPAKALTAYRSADDTPDANGRALASRRAFTLLRLDRSEDARHVVLRHLRRAEITSVDLELVTYLTRQGVAAAVLAEELVPIYTSKAHTPRMALLIAELLGADKGQAFLKRHLAVRPADRVVFEYLLRAELGSDVGPPALETVTRLLLTTADAVAGAPAAGTDLATILFEVLPDRGTLLEALATLAPPQRERTAIRFIEVLCLMHLGNTDAARIELERIVKDDPDMAPARVELAKMLIAAGAYEQAEKLLDGLANQSGPQVVLLRAGIMARTGRVPRALEMLDVAIAEQTSAVELIVVKAGIQSDANDHIAAEQTLLDALITRPEAEPIYEALFRLYNRRLVPDAETQSIRLMQSLLGAIPQSRLARLNLARAYINKPDLPAAERLLRQVLDEHPADVEALAVLLRVLKVSDRLGDPVEVETLALIDRALAQPDPGAERVALLLGLALEPVEDVAAMDAVFQERIARFPRHEADLTHAWAATYDRRGDRPRSEQIMVDLVKKFPDHALTNNFLGYLWAWRGVHLEQALAMISSAVAKEPDNAAYLDSLGWVNYKLGNFEQALRSLKQASNAEGGQDAIVLDHVGDALYRLGRVPEAVIYWNRSMQDSHPDDAQSPDPERSSLRGRLARKIGAAANNAPAPVAEVPTAEDAAVPPAP